MRDYVWKAFNAAERRFREGDPVKETDDFSPHNYDDLMKNGFIGEGKKPAEVAPKTAEKASASKSGEAITR